MFNPNKPICLTQNTIDYHALYYTKKLQWPSYLILNKTFTQFYAVVHTIVLIFDVYMVNDGQLQ